MKWEYKVIKFTAVDKTIDLSKALTKFSDDHWRLIHCSLSDLLFIFERPAQAEMPEDQEHSVNYFGGKVG